jgi:hypothetical protein
MGMRILAAATALIAALLVGATAASAADIGANDDSAKHSADGGAGIYGEMAALGLRQTVIGVRFKPSEPIVIQDKQLLDLIIPNALAAGLRVVIAVYPYPPREVEAGLGSPSLFGSYAAAVASIYPQVKQFVIGNEPNQPAFWRPQFDSAGVYTSAKSFGSYLAAAYDALKSVDPALSVVGIGLSPRGNDRPDARNNVSTSPLRFLRALGAWYRASRRDRPLMDAFSFHPYPNQETDSLDRGYSWPNAGFVNLDRIKQALWDAFNGTAQPTTLEGLKLHLDELGWQVDTFGRLGYSGPENVPVTDEVNQAAIYGDLIRRAACDPDIAEVSFFGFRDDGSRTGFQSALQRADGSARPSAEAVRTAIAETAGGCAGEMYEWQPGAEVVGAQVAVGAVASQVTARVSAGEDARALVCVRALEGRLTGGAGGPARTLQSRDALCRAARLIGLRPATVAVPAPVGVRDRLEVAVELAAEANRARRTVVVREAAVKR